MKKIEILTLRACVRMHIIGCNPNNIKELLNSFDRWSDQALINANQDSNDVHKIYKSLEKHIRISNQYNGIEILDDDDLDAAHVPGCPGYIYCHCYIGDLEERQRRMECYNER